VHCKWAPVLENLEKMPNVIIFLGALFSVTSAFAHADSHTPLQNGLFAPREPIQLLPSGTTRRMAADWAAPFVKPADGPDSSTKTIWLRIFPLINCPLGDPFPQTVDMNNIDFANADGLNVYRLDNGNMLGSATALHLDFSQNTFAIGNAQFPLVALWIAPAGSKTSELHWDKDAPTEVGMRVRGGFVVQMSVYTTDANDQSIPNPTPQWSVMNVLEVEKYLLAVVPSEVLSTWQPAMLEAQAIAARTYTLYQMTLARKNGRNWDLDPTTWYQSYRGVEFLVKGKWQTVESTYTSNAVTNSAGQAITYGGEVIDAYFSGNSGGVTCTAAECFGLPDVPYLQQVNDAPGVQSATGGTWGSKANITSQSITGVLTALGITPSSAVVKLAPYQKGPSGRTWQLSVIMKSGKINLTSGHTRKMMHLFGTIRSFLYTLGSVTGGKQSITGHGYGHGVGMSQEGGEIFAKQGWSAEKILTYFYSGTQIQAL
jgi:SpoIID/LytB domain protein